MTNDNQCGNDCVEKLLFPKTISNRPTLPHIDYRIGSFPQFLEALLRELNQDPVLAPWTHREPDDPGIALLEGTAVLGDILTFYQELYANEAFLRTAQWRESVAQLVKLTGYRLSPGVGGKATFAFEVKDDKNNSGKPVTIPAGFPIKAQVKGLEPPADFQTIKEFEALPALSNFHLYRPSDIPFITNGIHRFSVETSCLQQMGLQLSKGDRLMLANISDSGIPANQISMVSDIREKFERTEITIEGSWQGGNVGDTIKAYKIKRSFKHLGHNAPGEIPVLEGDMVVQRAVNFERVIGNRDLEVNFFPFPIDGEVNDISTGTTMLVRYKLIHPSFGLITALYERKVKRVNVSSAGELTPLFTDGFPLTGSTTVIELGYPFSVVENHINSDIRTVEILEVTGEGFILEAAREPNESADSSILYFYGDSGTYEKLDGRLILLIGNNRVEQTAVSIDEDALDPLNKSTLRPLHLDPSLQSFSLDDFPLEDPQVTVYGNLVEANQGKTAKEAVLGNGDNRQKFQTFKLPKTPLTYHKHPGETPAEVPELKVYVNDRLWEQVPDFFGKGPKEEIYIVREDDDGVSWVQFGDGKTGARLPTGTRNIKALYRTGTGAYGPLKEETTPQAGAKLDRFRKIHMPQPASGGDGPETRDNAREAAPGKMQSLGRLVALADFESEALALAGVSKAKAAWDINEEHSAVKIIILVEPGHDPEEEVEEVQNILNKYNNCRGSGRFPIIVEPGIRSYIYIHIEYGLHPSYREDKVEAAIKKVLGVSGEEGDGIDGADGLFGSRQRRFGQKAYASRIEGTVQEVEGVTWAKVKALELLGPTDDAATLEPPDTTCFSTELPCDDDSILCLYKKHLVFSVCKEEPVEEC